MIEPFQDFTLSIKHPIRGNISLTFHEDCDIEELKQIFTTILTWMTFHPDTISKLFMDEE
jgi:hypothetical protein